MAIVLLPELASRISADKFLSASIRVSVYYPVSISGRSARDLRRQQAQGVPGADKKIGSAPTGAVCRSCTTMPVHSRASPPGGETGTVFPALKYSAPAPCRSGSKGEAPWSLRKERNPGGQIRIGEWFRLIRLKLCRTFPGRGLKIGFATGIVKQPMPEFFPGGEGGV